MAAKSSSFAKPAQIGMALLIIGGLAACDSGSKSDKDNGGMVIVSPPPPPPPPALIEDSFGTRFGTIFRASANSDPVDPAQADITNSVDLTRDPTRLRP